MLDGPRMPPASGRPASSLVIFLHGYGADGNDLIGLGGELAQLLPDTGFVSPHAPEACLAAPPGRQWFPLTMRDPHEYARGVEVAKPALDAFIDAEMKRFGVRSGSVALVGFSQGTMMALHVGLQRLEPLAAIVGFSGLLADANAIASGPVTKPPVFLVHGDQDDVVPLPALFAAAKGLNAAGVPVEWHISRGLGHGIDPAGLQLMAGHLIRTLRD